MKRLVLSVCIFSFILLASIGGIVAFRHTTAKLCDLIDDCHSVNDSQNLEKLTDYWDNYYLYASLMTHSNLLEDMAVSVSRLDVLSQKNISDFESELDGLHYRAYLLYDEQFPHFRNIF